MVRVLLVVAALAAPALSAAQGVGQVLFVSDRVSPNTVNAFECDPASNPQVLVRWTPQFINGFTSAPVGATYVIYGSNTAAAASGTQCQTANDTSLGQNILAGTILNTNSSALNATISTAALLGVSGMSCANDGSTLYLCVQGVQAGSFNTVTNFAIAAATVTISTTFPRIPVVTQVTPGDGALNVSWEPDAAGTGTAITQQVELEVEPIASTTDAWDAGGPRVAGTFGASPARIDGLVNGVVYGVRARAFSDAGNASDFSPAGVSTGMPQAWAGSPPPAGGGGGCSSGVAGPLGIALLAGSLALMRTRRRR